MFRGHIVNRDIVSKYVHFPENFSIPIRFSYKDGIVSGFFFELIVSGFFWTNLEKTNYIYDHVFMTLSWIGSLGTYIAKQTIVSYLPLGPQSTNHYNYRFMHPYK